MPEYSNYLESRVPLTDPEVEGDELLGCSKDGSARSLTSQQIANLGGGGGGSGTVESVTGNGVDNTDPDNPVITDVNAAVALTDAASIDLTAIKHTLTNATGRTFTISYTGDDITIERTLNATSATDTFPATALCVSDGTASGNNSLSLAGVSGDKYIIAIKKVGSAYYVVSKNFGQ